MISKGCFVDHGFSTFFYSAKNHYQIFHSAKKITTTKQNFQKNHYRKNKIFKHNDILYIIQRSSEFFGKFRTDFSEKITTAVVIFLEKTSPANFKNSPANNFGVQARLRTPDSSHCYFSSLHLLLNIKVTFLFDWYR